MSRKWLIYVATLVSDLTWSALLQLHRTFFIEAVSGFDEAFNRQHRYAPSVVAVFLSASRMIAAVHDLYKWAPTLTARFLGFWTNAFSSAVSARAETSDHGTSTRLFRSHFPYWSAEHRSHVSPPPRCKSLSALAYSSGLRRMIAPEHYRFLWVQSPL